MDEGSAMESRRSLAGPSANCLFQADTVVMSDRLADIEPAWADNDIGSQFAFDVDEAEEKNEFDNELKLNVESIKNYKTTENSRVHSDRDNETLAAEEV